MRKRLETWQLRAKFAAALSHLYGVEVPAYNTLIKVSAQVNRELGASDRVTAERLGAIRVGGARELAVVVDLFAAAAPVPVVSTAFRRIDTDELARNPFRVFTSMLTASGLAYRCGDPSKPHHVHHPSELYEKVASS
jgi:uncharacterized glyoxalase superfamily metalloenzyme YdcJ